MLSSFKDQNTRSIEKSGILIFDACRTMSSAATRASIAGPRVGRSRGASWPRSSSIQAGLVDDPGTLCYIGDPAPEGTFIVLLAPPAIGVLTYLFLLIQPVLVG